MCNVSLTLFIWLFVMCYILKKVWFWLKKNDSENETSIELHENFSVVIEKVRKISKIFRKSPLKNEKLQDFIRRIWERNETFT